MKADRQNDTDPAHPRIATDLAAQNAQLAAQLGRSRADIERWGTDWPDAGNDLFSKRMARLEATVEQQSSEIKALTDMLEAHPMAEYVANLERERDELEAQVEDLEFRHRRMLASSSWKLTKPLRAVANVLSGTLRRRD